MDFGIQFFKKERGYDVTDGVLSPTLYDSEFWQLTPPPRDAVTQIWGSTLRSGGFGEMIPEEGSASTTPNRNNSSRLASTFPVASQGPAVVIKSANKKPIILRPETKLNYIYIML